MRQLPFESRFISAADGLRLHARDYGSALDDGIPAVCLPGLSRNSADFGLLASALAAGRFGKKRRVIAVDYRGRGLSAYDKNWKNYSLPIENRDILSVLAALEVDRAIFIGTSRGGLHAMLLSATRPTALQGVVLNDIGPVLEPLGMARIRGYIGKLPEPASVADAIALSKTVMSGSFTSLSKADWEAYARITYEDELGRIGTRYDKNLAQTLTAADLEKPLPTFWPQFDGLRNVPLLILRGGNSDLLSTATVKEMVFHHPEAETYTIEGQGHPPLLLDEQTISRICHFAASIDSAVQNETFKSNCAL
ncbi:MAG TPA: alpha/beta hydrolase [Methylocella sp.]|nr:alpha/beta hydrolase [Methylocella sp.]